MRTCAAFGMACDTASQAVLTTESSSFGEKLIRRSTGCLPQGGGTLDHRAPGVFLLGLECRQGTTVHQQISGLTRFRGLFTFTRDINVSHSNVGRGEIDVIPFEAVDF